MVNVTASYSPKYIILEALSNGQALPFLRTGFFWQVLESIHEFFIELSALLYLFLRESNKQKRGVEIIPNFTKGDLFHFI